MEFEVYSNHDLGAINGTTPRDKRLTYYAYMNKFLHLLGIPTI